MLTLSSYRFALATKANAFKRPSVVKVQLRRPTRLAPVRAAQTDTATTAFTELQELLEDYKRAPPSFVGQMLSHDYCILFWLLLLVGMCVGCVWLGGLAA